MLFTRVVGAGESMFSQQSVAISRCDGGGPTGINAFLAGAERFSCINVPYLIGSLPQGIDLLALSLTTTLNLTPHDASDPTLLTYAKYSVEAAVSATAILASATMLVAFAFRLTWAEQ